MAFVQLVHLYLLIPSYPCLVGSVMTCVLAASKQRRERLMKIGCSYIMDANRMCNILLAVIVILVMVVLMIIFLAMLMLPFSD